MYIVCASCHTILRIGGDPEGMERLFGRHSDWYPSKFPCPACGHFAESVLSVHPLALKSATVYDLTISEAYAALNGLGLPDEQECGPLAIKKLFDEHKVTRVSANIVPGTNRSSIDFLEFEDGSRMYFGISPHGATVYRISAKH